MGHLLKRGRRSDVNHLFNYSEGPRLDPDDPFGLLTGRLGEKVTSPEGERRMGDALKTVQASETTGVKQTEPSHL